MKKLILALALLFLPTVAHAGVNCSVPFNLTNGTTADATQVMANYNAILACLSTSTAHSGANSDITSLTGLTTPITPAQGGAIGLCGVTGFTAINNTGTPNSQLDIVFRQAIVTNSLGAVQYGTGGALTLNFGTTGANGIDAGSLAASTTYNIFLIGNGTTISALGSLSATAPTMPSGYTFMCRVGAWVTGTGATLLPLQQRGRITQATTASLSTLTTAGLFESHVVIAGCNADPVTLVATTFGGLPATAIGAMGSINSNGTNQVSLGTAAGSVAVKFLIANISNPAGSLAYTIPFTIELATPQVLNVCNASTFNQINIFGWTDSVNAN